LTVTLVSDRDILNPAFIHDVRVFAHQLGISRDGWRDYLVNSLRDYPGRIVDASGQDVELDTEVFEQPNIRDWFRDICCTLPAPNGARYIRREARERFRVMATILKAKFPNEALLWGIRPANDN
jgi:hypothetical protein